MRFGRTKSDRVQSGPGGERPSFENKVRSVELVERRLSRGESVHSYQSGLVKSGQVKSSRFDLDFIGGVGSK